MDAKAVIKNFFDMSAQICMAYVDDLTDADLLRRPSPGCNHINWQIGHLILSEHSSVSKLPGAAFPALPSGFAEKYKPEKAEEDNPAAFCTKAELLAAFQSTRAATLAILAKLDAADFDKPSGVEWAPNLGALLSAQGGHWLMHAGQWVVVRRQLGRAPLF
jgi:hypothetical protein